MLRAVFGLFDKAMGSQWGCPHGPLGWLAGKLMARGNAQMNDLALEALAARPGDRVLEIGFGPGIALERLAAQVGDGGAVAGIDPSRTMLAQARRRLQRDVEDGRVDLREGRSSRLPFADASFDRVFTVNTVYFWDDPRADIAEVRRVTKPGGVFVLALRTEEVGGALNVHGMPGTTAVVDVASWLRDASFTQVTDQRRDVSFGPTRVTAVALTAR